MAPKRTEISNAFSTTVTWEADPATFRILKLSPRTELLLGYHLEAWQKDDFWRVLLDERDQQRFLSTIAQVASERSEAMCEVRIVDRVSGSHWFVVNVRSVRCKTQPTLRLRGRMMRLDACTEERAKLERANAEWEAVCRKLERDAVLSNQAVDLNLALAAATTMNDLVETIVDQALFHIGARAGALVLLTADGMHLELARSIGVSREFVENLRHFSVLAPLPVSDSVRTEKPLWFESRDALIGRYPLLERSASMKASKAFAVVPLAVHGEWFGGLQMHFDDEHAFDTTERARIIRLVDICAQALQRVRARQSADQATALLEDAARRLDLLTRATPALGASLQYEATLTAVGYLAVPALADWCATDIRDDDGTIRRIAVTTADNSKVGVARQLQQYRPPNFSALRGAARVLQTGCSELVSKVGAPLAGDDSVHPEQIDLVNQLGCESYMIVPLVVRERLLGAMTFVLTRQDRRYQKEDLVVAEALAHRAALAIENARLFGETNDAVREKENILSVVSHDLRNPLASIVMSVSALLRSEPALSDLARRCAEMIQKSASHATKLVDDLLDFGTIESKRLRLKLARYDCIDLVAQAVELLEPLATQRSLQLVRGARFRTCEAYCDRDRVLQVLSNLIGNAIKFCTEGKIVVDCTEEDTEVVFAVHDTGPGIPADEIEKVFLARWHTLQPGREGTGLGLSISRSLVEAQGGRIWVESKLGGGSSFYFTLPRAPTPGIRTHPAVKPSLSGIEPRTTMTAS